jgi:hypothetical protein
MDRDGAKFSGDPDALVGKMLINPPFPCGWPGALLVDLRLPPVSTPVSVSMFPVVHISTSILRRDGLIALLHEMTRMPGGAVAPTGANAPESPL